MADSTDKDAARFALSQEIGVIESEGESLARRGISVDDDGVSGEDGGSLQIVESSAEVQQESASDDVTTPGDSRPDGGDLQSPLNVAGFGEIDTGSSDDDDCGGDAVGVSRGGAGYPFDDDALSNHSSGSDARHGLDYLHDQHGGLLSYLLMPS